MTFSLIFNKEALLLVTDREINPGLTHAEHQLLYLAEIRLIRETEKNNQRTKKYVWLILYISLYFLYNTNISGKV